MEYNLPKKPKIKEKTPAPDQRKFAVVPLHIIDKAVTLESLRVLIVLSSYCNKAGFSHVSLNRIANDLGTTAQTVSYHMSRLQRLKIVKKISGHYTMIKGATRRIIYDDKISNEDASRIAQAPIEPYNNSEITSMIKAKHINNNKDIEEAKKSHSSNESRLSYNEEVTSLLECVSSESELARLTILIESGASLESLREHINKGASVLSYKG
jgi:DNA-binding Lrp family transcriptional regulator